MFPSQRPLSRVVIREQLKASPLFWTEECEAPAFVIEFGLRIKRNSDGSWAARPIETPFDDLNAITARYKRVQMTRVQHIAQAVRAIEAVRAP